MGREIKRVALDFNWALGVIWKGFVNPYRSQECTACKGSGYNPETKRIADDWYDFEGTGREWCHNITQDEVDALIENGRLMDFTHNFVRGKGWTKIEPPPQITAEMVNEWSKHGLAHDAINRGICVETRAKRLGVFGYCPVCNGDGEIYFNDHIKELNENWYEKERYEPPAGEGWQVWETVSEGSPVTPVFPTKEALIEYLVQNGDLWDQKRGDGGWSRKNAEHFVNQGWSPSGVVVDGEYKTPRDGA